MARTLPTHTEDPLESTASRIEGLAADYKTQYDQLYSETNAMASKWIEKDNIAFVNQIDGFKDDFAEMYALMLSYADFLRKSAKEYRDIEDTLVFYAKSLFN